MTINTDSVTLFVSQAFFQLCRDGFGPFFCRPNVNGDRHLDIINNDVVPFIDQNIPRFRRSNGSEQFEHGCWAQDGAPWHRRLTLRDHQAELFGNRIIALNHAIEWPKDHMSLPQWIIFSLGPSQITRFLRVLLQAGETDNCRNCTLRHDRALIRRSVYAIIRGAQMEICICASLIMA